MNHEPIIMMRHGVQGSEELRRAKRREEKLQAMLFRMREDLAAQGRDPALFDQLQEVRGLEYELDFQANRAARDVAVSSPADKTRRDQDSSTA